MLLIEKNYYFCIRRIKRNYYLRELVHKSSTLMKIFGRSATATGLVEQGSSPVQTASKFKSPYKSTICKDFSFEYECRAEFFSYFDIKQFNFENVTLLNDYEALIYAIPHLNTNDIKTISKVTTGLDGAPFGAFGVGSGLGAAIGVPYKNNVSAVPTEIGHISFGSRSKREYKLMRHYKKSITHISIETFLSGPGLTRIYDFLKDPDQPSRTAAEITTYAQSGKCETCINTLMMFTNMLARITGDIALAHGARGGIYIGGGIIPRIVDFIDMKRFMKHFHNKGPMRSYVEGIPVHIITTEMPSLLGAAIKL